MRILVRPCYPCYLHNKLFVADHVSSISHISPYIHLRQRAAELGWEMSTWDMHPLESADVVLVQDLPVTRNEMIRARERAPRAKFVLQLLETPLGRPAYWVKRNHDLFDAVLTYRADLCDERRYFRYYLPVGRPQSVVPNRPFAERKPLVLVNSNRMPGLRACRQAGLQGLPFLGPLFSGWSFSIYALMNQNRGELYTRRRRIAHLADQIAPTVFDVWGGGWTGEPISWVHPLIRSNLRRVGRGPFNGDKLELLPRYRFALAYENIRGNVGYISEKLLDPLQTGVAPIYLGDENITDVVPAECFVDARKFRNDQELLRFAIDCPEADWRGIVEAGERYRNSPRAKVFSSEYFADTVLGVLRKVARPTAANLVPDHSNWK